ncbi:MAG: hypothetical protein ACRENC_15655, partial [Gemmatimonadaceae bacterium]
SSGVTSVRSCCRELGDPNVGSQRPFTQVSRALPTDNTARDQVVQYKDVGTKLTQVSRVSRTSALRISNNPGRFTLPLDQYTWINRLKLFAVSKDGPL